MDIGKDLAKAYEEGTRDARAKMESEILKLQAEVSILNNQLAAKEKAHYELQLEFETYKGVEKIIDDSIPKMIEGIKAQTEKQKAEIERLERICNSYALKYGTVTDQQKVIDKAKAEVIKELDDGLHDVALAYYEGGQRAYFAVCEVIHHKVIRPIEKKYTEGATNE